VNAAATKMPKQKMILFVGRHLAATNALNFLDPPLALRLNRPWAASGEDSSINRTLFHIVERERMSLMLALFF
jgi:hypothetical protein